MNFKSIYASLIEDLNFNAGKIPLLAGGVANTVEQFAFSGMKKISGELPESISKLYINHRSNVYPVICISPRQKPFR